MRTSSLSVEEVKYFVHLGCSASEREQPQEVQVSVTVDFAQTPGACLSDRLEESLCYAQLCGRIDEVCQSKSFNTIEYLAQNCWEALETMLAAKDVMTLKVHKVNPPLGRSLSGCSFELKGSK